MIHNYIIIIGRESDKENCYAHYKNMTTKQAIELFNAYIISDSDYTKTEWDRKGKEVYIDAIMTSKSPIEMDWMY